jgi:hypothetical protein
MKKISLTTIGLIILSTSVFAQSFDWKTNDSIQEYDSLGGSYMSLYMVNNTNDSLRLDWHFVENSFPVEWDWTLCDYNTCYIIVPDTGSMTTLKDKEEAYLSLSVNTNKHPATGVMRFYVYNDLNPSYGDTATFLLTSTYTGIYTIDEREETANIFPNPASNFISVTNMPVEAEEWWITDVSGKVSKHDFVRDQQESFDISDLPNGMYLFTLTKEGTKLLNRRFIKH